MGYSTYGKTSTSQTSLSGFGKSNFGGVIGFKGDLRAQRPAPGKTSLPTSGYSGYGGDNMTGYGPNVGAQRSSYSMKNPTQRPYDPATSPKPVKVSVYEAATTAAKKNKVSPVVSAPQSKKIAPSATKNTTVAPVKQTAYQQQQVKRMQEEVGPKRSMPSTSRSTSKSTPSSGRSGGYNMGGRPSRGRSS